MDGRWGIHSQECIQHPIPWNFQQFETTADLEGKGGTKVQILRLDVTTQKKILTANNLIKRNWPNDPICKLCGTDPETATHLCKDCVFSKQVWSDLKQWLGLTAIDIVPMTCSIHSYWRKCRAKIDKDRRKAFDCIMIYLWWNVWKERNRRTFQNKSMQPRQVALLCKEALEQYQLATGNNGRS